MVMGKKIKNMDKSQLVHVCLEKLDAMMLVYWATEELNRNTKEQLIDEIKRNSDMDEETEVVI